MQEEGTSFGDAADRFSGGGGGGGGPSGGPPQPTPRRPLRRHPASSGPAPPPPGARAAGAAGAAAPDRRSRCTLGAAARPAGRSDAASLPRPPGQKPQPARSHRDRRDYRTRLTGEPRRAPVADEGPRPSDASGRGGAVGEPRNACEGDDGHHRVDPHRGGEEAGVGDVEAARRRAPSRRWRRRPSPWSAEIRAVPIGWKASRRSSAGLKRPRLELREVAAAQHADPADVGIDLAWRRRRSGPRRRGRCRRRAAPASSSVSR